MLQKIKSFIKENLIIVFIIFILIAIVWGLIFNYKLENSNENEIENVINKFSINDYSLPYYIAERYVIWLDMRKIYFWTYFSLSLFSVVASLVTVFFATQNDEERKKKKETYNYIIFIIRMFYYSKFYYKSRTKSFCHTTCMERIRYMYYSNNKQQIFI